MIWLPPYFSTPIFSHLLIQRAPFVLVTPDSFVLNASACLLGHHALIHQYSRKPSQTISKLKQLIL